MSTPADPGRLQPGEPAVEPTDPSAAPPARQQDSGTGATASEHATASERASAQAAAELSDR